MNDTATSPALVLITGPERVLADRALAETLEVLTAAQPDAEVIRVDAQEYQPGRLTMDLSPSLFGGHRIVVVRDLDEAPDALVDEVDAALRTSLDEAHLVVMHKGGNRARRSVEAMKKAKARVIEAPAMKSDRDKSAFVTNEFRRARRKITPDAVRALLEAAGKDTSELAAACRQLVDDTTGVIDEDVVGGIRVEIGDEIIDGTVSHRLADARRRMTS